jgi:hypothetical protein
MKSHPVAQSHLILERFVPYCGTDAQVSGKFNACDSDRLSLNLLTMRTLLLFLLLLTSCRFCDAQNLIANSDFENNGQPYCYSWYDRCGSELTYLCAGVIDTICNSAMNGAQLYNNAPPTGGQQCIKLAAWTYAQYVTTYITGQFWGVYEFSVWFKEDTDYGVRPMVSFIYRNGNMYTGSGGNQLPNHFNYPWSLYTYRDTIKSLSDTVIIALNCNRSSPSLSGYIIYYDLPEFRMVESWTDVSELKEADHINLFPNPFSHQLTFKLADNEQTTVILYNFLGQQVLLQTFTNSTTLNTEQLADGIYFYELRSNKGTLKTGKVVKQ